jgi:hypothetical protein
LRYEQLMLPPSRSAAKNRLESASKEEFSMAKFAIGEKVDNAADDH